MRDRYLVERELGEGGAATVYLARDIRHERPVAIKVLRPDLGETLGPDRFTREIRTAANLQHPHILTVHDSGAADGLLYYVMPFVEGESLRARLEREGSGLPIADVVRILHDVADALAFAHKRGVVHRDIKPDNVLLNGKHALVADFGVAKAISEATGRQNLTTMGVALGTPAYMAPEQAAADPHLDHRVDVYALGVLGYELLVGETPFVRRTTQAVIAAHMTEPAPRAGERRPATPPSLDALIAKCLEKQPADRWQSAEEIVAELERLSTPSGTAPMTAAAKPASMKPATPRGRAIAIAALAVLVLAIGGWLATRRSGGSPLDGNAVAVLPFEFNAAPDLAYLREGIVNILESSLTGEGGPRAVASQTTIARWKRVGGTERGLTEEEARAIARDLGAGQLLRGSIVGTASNLILSATLVPSSGSGSAVKATVNGPADSIAALGARLATQLLSLRIGESAERLHNLALVPPAALRAYLEGQVAFRSAKYAEAEEAFGRALAIDSTFALAAFAHAIATSWSPVSYGSSNGADIAFRNRDKLSPRDRVLLEMWLPARFAGRALTGRETMAVRERLVQQIPDRPEAWYLIGDAYFHYGRAYGYTLDESAARAESAFRRALALDPGINYLRYHLVDVVFLKPDRISGTPHIIDSLGIREFQYDVLAAVIRGDSSNLRRLRAQLPSREINELIATVFFGAFIGATSVVDSAARIALERSGDAAARGSTMRWIRGMRWLQGRPLDAARLTGRLDELDDERAPDLESIYASIFADGDSAQARQAAARFGSRRMQARLLSLAEQRTALWAEGLWASYVADSGGVSRAIRGLDSLAARRDTTGQWQLTQMRADILRLSMPGRAPDRDIVSRVDSLLRDGPSIDSDTRAAMNLIVARNLERLGDNRRAARAATRTSVGELMFVMPGPALRDQGRLWLAAGDTAAAIDAWRLYLQARSGAEPAQRKADDEIRHKLEAIQRARR